MTGGRNLEVKVVYMKQGGDMCITQIANTGDEHELSARSKCHFSVEEGDGYLYTYIKT